MINNLIIEQIKFFISKNNYFSLFLNLVSSIFLIYLFIRLFSNLDFQISVLKKNAFLITILIFLSLLKIFLRSVRFKNLFYFKKKKLNIFESFKITCKSYALHNLLPFHIGEFYKIYVVRNLLNIKYPQVVSLIILERGCDLLIVILFSFPILLKIYFHNTIMIAFGLALLFIFILFILKKLNSNFLKKNLIQVFLAFSFFKRQFIKFMVITIFIYLVEFLIYYSFVLILKIDINILQVLLIISVSILFPVFFPSPGGLGSFQYSVIFIMTSFFFIEDSLAIKYSIFTHFLLIIPVTTIGILFFIKNIFINNNRVNTS